LTIKYGVTGSSFFGNINKSSCVGSAICSTVAGGYDLSTSTTEIGLNTFTWSISKADFNGLLGTHRSDVFITPPGTFLGIFTGQATLTASSTSWQYGGLSFFDKVSPFLDTAMSNANGSTTLDWSSCNVLSGFNPQDCFGTLLTSLFVINDTQAAILVGILHDDVLTRFPLGYITDFVGIISSSTATSTLPFIDAVIPPGVAGAGAHAVLAITPHMLDYVWNATTSQFTNSSAPSTETLAQIVEGYWDKVVYLLLLIYLLSRLIGSHLFSREQHV